MCFGMRVFLSFVVGCYCPPHSSAHNLLCVCVCACVVCVPTHPRTATPAPLPAPTPAPCLPHSQVTAMAATGNLTLVREMGQVMGRELRAINNQAKRLGIMPNKGAFLSIYGPTMNIIRDPRQVISSAQDVLFPSLLSPFARHWGGPVRPPIAHHQAIMYRSATAAGAARKNLSARTHGSTGHTQSTSCRGSRAMLRRPATL